MAITFNYYAIVKKQKQNPRREDAFEIFEMWTPYPCEMLIHNN